MYMIISDVYVYDIHRCVKKKKGVKSQMQRVTLALYCALMAGLWIIIVFIFIVFVAEL